MPDPKRSSDIRIFFKRAVNQRKLAPEKEGNAPSNDIKSGLIVSD